MNNIDKLDNLTSWADIYCVAGLSDKTPKELLELKSLCLRDEDYASYPDKHGGSATYIPDEIDALQNLEELTIDLRFVSKLPSAICNLTNLKTLHIFLSTPIDTLPNDMYKLKNLKTITLQGERFKTVPPQLLSFPNLKSLHLGSSQLKEFPKEILEFKNLETLVLSYNKLKEIPPEISGLM